MFLLLFILLNINSVIADQESEESRYIELLPENEKKEFLEKITKRILDEVETKHVNIKSGEVPDDKLNIHSDYIKNLLKEETDNLRRRAAANDNKDVVEIKKSNKVNEGKNKETERSGNTVELDEKKINNDDAAVDFTLRKGNKTLRAGINEDFDHFEKDRDITVSIESNEEDSDEYGDDEFEIETITENPNMFSSELVKVETLNETYNTSSITNNILVDSDSVNSGKADNISIEIEIIEDKLANMSVNNDEIPAKIVYDDNKTNIEGSKTIEPKTEIQLDEITGAAISKQNGVQNPAVKENIDVATTKQAQITENVKESYKIESKTANYNFSNMISNTSKVNNSITTTKPINKNIESVQNKILRRNNLSHEIQANVKGTEFPKKIDRRDVAAQENKSTNLINLKVINSSTEINVTPLPKADDSKFDSSFINIQKLGLNETDVQNSTKDTVYESKESNIFNTTTETDYTETTTIEYEKTSIKSKPVEKVVPVDTTVSDLGSKEDINSNKSQVNDSEKIVVMTNGKFELNASSTSENLLFSSSTASPKIILQNEPIIKDKVLQTEPLLSNDIGTKTEYITWPKNLDSTTKGPDKVTQTESTLSDEIGTRTEYISWPQNFDSTTKRPDKVTQTESTISDEIGTRTQYISWPTKICNSTTTEAEEIVQARTEFITGKYDSDLSQESQIGASKENETMIIKEEKSSLQLEKIKDVVEKVVNTTAIPMDPNENVQRNKKDAVVEYVTAAPLPMLTTVSPDNAVTLSHTPSQGMEDSFVVANDNEIKIVGNGNGKTAVKNLEKVNIYKSNLRTTLNNADGKAYRVYEVLPKEEPFKKQQAIDRVRLMDVTDTDLVKVQNEDKRISNENVEPSFVPVYNYAPENAYYNPLNKYGPNEPGYFVDKAQSEEKYTFSKSSEKFFDEFKHDNDDNVQGKKNKDLFYLLGLRERPKKKKKYYLCSEESEDKSMKKFPNSNSMEHEYNALLHDKEAYSHFHQLKRILHNRNLFGYAHYQTTTAKIPTFSTHYPMMPPFKARNETSSNKETYLRDRIIPVVVKKLSNVKEIKRPKFVKVKVVRKPKFDTKPDPLILLTGHIPNAQKNKKPLEMSADYVFPSSENVDPTAAEEQDLIENKIYAKKKIGRAKSTSEYEYYSDPEDVSSGDVESMKTLNTEAIELVLNMTDTKHIYPILQKLNQIYNNDTMPAMLRSQMPAILRSKIPQFKEKKTKEMKLQNFVQVIQDMVQMNNKGLEKYEWLRSTVDIRSAIKKMISLCERIRTGAYIHPKDVQLIKYLLYLHKSNENLIEPEPSLPIDSRMMRRRSLFPEKQRPWTVKPKNQEDIDSFEKFWIGVEYLLDDVHNAIKHIALITNFKSQHWFRNLKELYLGQPSRKQALELLLHLMANNVITLVEYSSKNGLEENYVKYAMTNNLEVEMTKHQVGFLVKVFNELKRER